MDEAKTMCKVGSYHENIVNLQGITVGVEDESIRRVCFLVMSIIIILLCFVRFMNICKMLKHVILDDTSFLSGFLDP